MTKFPKLPNERFDIIYADPPWAYGNPSMFMGEKRTSAATDHYSTVRIHDLMELNVRDISSDSCLLFMWITNPHLDQGIKLAEHWGFSYKTIAFVWDKQITNPGFYTMSQCELCYVFKKGKIPQPRGARNVRQFISQKRGEHSAKHVEVRERIQAMFPIQSKIELFARRSKCKDWSVWGNETEQCSDKAI